MTTDLLKRAAARKAAYAVAWLLLLPWTASAQGFAVRTGANINPDQFAVGGQYEIGPISNRVWFQPNADIGFGDGTTLVTADMDFVYRRPLAKEKQNVWTLYAGAGSAVNFYKLSGYHRTLAGVNVLGGLMHRNGLFTQFTIGFVDSPRFKFGVGYTFHPKLVGRKRVPKR